MFNQLDLRDMATRKANYARGFNRSEKTNREYVSRLGDSGLQGYAQRIVRDRSEALKYDNQISRRSGKAKDADDIEAQLGRIAALRDLINAQNIVKSMRTGSEVPNIANKRLNKAFRIADRTMNGSKASIAG